MAPSFRAPKNLPSHVSHQSRFPAECRFGAQQSHLPYAHHLRLRLLGDEPADTPRWDQYYPAVANAWLYAQTTLGYS